MPKFKILNKQIFKDYNLILKPISKVDIEKIRIWRNSQTSFLRQSKIISKYSNDFTGIVGFNVVQDIVTASDDVSLFDNQGQFPNISAP